MDLCEISVLQARSIYGVLHPRLAPSSAILITQFVPRCFGGSRTVSHTYQPSPASLCRPQCQIAVAHARLPLLGERVGVRGTETAENPRLYQCVWRTH